MKTTIEEKPPVTDVLSPIDGKKIGEVVSLTIEEALVALGRAHQAQEAWGAASHAERGRVLRAFLDLLRRRQDEVAQLLTMESGKSRFEAYVFEIASIIHLGDYFLRNAERILKPRKISISLYRNRNSYLHYKPRGVVLVISPWNFPLSNSLGEVLMSLIAGNAVFLKPASLTPLTAGLMRKMAVEAGLNPDLFQVITGPGRLASELIEKGDLNYVSFTGSTATGRTVAEICGRRLIPCTMELGGKAPALVLADANVERAVRSVVWGAFANSGQICASVERALVHESIYQRFVEKAVTLTESLRQDDPRRCEVDIGSMTDPRQLDTVESLVQDAVAHGARILTGGKRAAAGPNFYKPTILVDVTEDMRVMREESFGPVLPVMSFREEEEAIRIANNTPYGLLASVFSQQQAHGRRVAERIRAGTVIINDTLITHAFPEVPWQGIKESGLGRVHSDDGLRDLCLTLHVNQELIQVENPSWYPYTEGKLTRVLSLVDLTLAHLPFNERFRALIGLVTGRRS